MGFFFNESFDIAMWVQSEELHVAAQQEDPLRDRANQQTGETQTKKNHKQEGKTKLVVIFKITETLVHW